jgi:ubiquinol-cytochrome c reductase cytochrome b subunit
VGSNNPDGVEIKEKKDERASRWTASRSTRTTRCTTSSACRVPDGLLAVVFFAPEMGGYFLEYNNFIPADPLKTPPHIAPVWYFTPFYSMLRATTADFMGWLMPGWRAMSPCWLKSRLTAKMKIVAIVIGLAIIAGMLVFDAKFWGVVVMGLSVVILFFLPWLDIAGQVDPLPSQLAQVRVPGLGLLRDPGLPRRAAAVGHRHHRVAGVQLLYFGFFLLMPWWSAGHVQAGARARRLPSALSQPPKDKNMTLLKKVIAALALLPALACANEGGIPLDKAPDRTKDARCSTAPSCSSTTA